jgi:hypothetical protein
MMSTLAVFNDNNGLATADTAGKKQSIMSTVSI